MLVRIQRKRNPCTLLIAIQIGTVTVKEYGSWLGQICRIGSDRVHNISKIGGEWFSQVSSYLGLGRGRGPQKEMPSVSPFALGEVS